MEQSIVYQIALEYIVLHTSEASLVRKVFDKYQTFEREALPLGAKPVLSVWGGEAIAVPQDAKLLETVKDYAYQSRVYAVDEVGDIYIEMVYRGLRVLARVSSDWHELHLSVPLSSSRHQLLVDRLVMVAFSQSTNKLGLLKVHASVVELGGDALVFMGVSGTGKSTHSRLWLEHIPGATLLNDDEPIVRLVDGEVLVFGCPWSGSTPCYRDASARVRGFVHLYQAPFNKLERMPLCDAFNSLYTSCAFMLSLPQSRSIVFNAVADILQHIPIYRLDNRPDLEAVRLTHSILTSSQ